MSEKWYFKKRSIVIAFIVIGPFAIPLVWAKPGLSAAAKVFWTIVMVGLTFLLTAFLGWLVHVLLEMYRPLLESARTP